MSTQLGPELLWTEKERAEFNDKLRTFREKLPEGQRKAFNAILGGATAAFRLVNSAGVVENEGASFAQALNTFRDGLPRAQRDAFTSIMTAGGVAWAVAANRAPEEQTEAIWVFHPLLHLLHLTPGAVIATGVWLIVDELIEDDPEVLIPDIEIPMD